MTIQHAAATATAAGDGGGPVRGKLIASRLVGYWLNVNHYLHILFLFQHCLKVSQPRTIRLQSRKRRR